MQIKIVHEDCQIVEYSMNIVTGGGEWYIGTMRSLILRRFSVLVPRVRGQTLKPNSVNHEHWVSKATFSSVAPKADIRAAK